MAEIVLVHGIGQENETADGLEAKWIPALAGGVRVAGRAHLADRLWRQGRPAGIDTRMAYYGDLFRASGLQGGEAGAANQLGPGVPEVIEQLARAWLSAAVERGSPRDRAAAQSVLLHHSHRVAGQQGAGAVVRPLVNGLASIPWFAPFGLAAAGKFVWRTLDQVSRYFTDDSVRTVAKGRVLELIDKDTRLIIGHSLGTVVAYEAMFETRHPLGLVTLGSPLGLRGAVYERLRPQPPQTPPSVRSWTNVADADDLVAAMAQLRALFPPDQYSGPIPFGDHLSDNGARPHEAERYLGRRSVGNAVGAVWAG